MAVIILWSYEAIKTFDTNVKYLSDNWTEKEIKSFLKQTKDIFIRIQRYPEMYAPSLKAVGVRKVAINKYIIWFYRYYSSSDKIILLTFWHNKQNPARMKY